jgi:glutaconate CoA-transferase subunit B
VVADNMKRCQDKMSSLGVFGFDESGEMILMSLHPDIMEDEMQANTGWPLRVITMRTETPVPTTAEIALIRQFDALG